MTYELRVIVDGLERTSIVLETKPAKIGLSLTRVDVIKTETLLGAKEIVVP